MEPTSSSPSSGGTRRTQRHGRTEREWRPWSGADLVSLLQPVMKAVAAAVGPSCELVLHDLTQGPDRTIVAIENGSLTGRIVGGSSTNLGLEVMHTEQDDTDTLGYHATAADGRELRSSSVYFRNPDGEVVAAFCINFDLTVYQSVRGLMEEMLQFPGATSQQEIFVGDITDVLGRMIDDALSQVGPPVAKMNKADRLRVIQTLEDRGAFVVKSAVDTVAHRLKISRVTVYSYLDEVRSNSIDNPR